MKITLSVDILQRKLSFINKAVSNKNHLPVLQNILFEAKGDTFTLSATDLEIGMLTSAKVAVLEEGSITVPTKQFIELIQSLPQETITIETKDKSLLVVSKKTRSTFQTIPGEEFPKLFDEKGILVAKIKTAELYKDIASVVFAASQDTTKPALSGILVKQEEHGFLLVGTDGYRLSLKHHGVQTQEETDGKEIIIPARLFRELLSIKEQSDEMAMFIARESNQVVFETGETILVGRLIDATYPNYERIIPLDYSAKTVFNRQEMLKAVKITSIFARDSANIITFSLKKDAIQVASQAGAIGENTVTVEANLSGEENEIAFNGKYLIDVLSNLDTEMVTFEMTGPLNPGAFKIENDASFLHIIMPIRVQE